MDLTSIHQFQITLSADPIKNTQAIAKLTQLGQIITAVVVSQNKQGELVLNIEGEKLSAASNQQLKPGDNLNLKLVQLPTLPLAKALNVPIQQVTPAQTTLLLTAPEPMIKNWQAGSVMQAIVVDQRPSGQTLLDIGGRLIQADVAQVLSRGQPVALQINSLTNPVLAQIVGQTTSTQPGTSQTPVTPGQTSTQTGATQAGTTPTAVTTSPTVSLNAAIPPSLRLQLPPSIQQSIQVGENLNTTVVSSPKNGQAVLNINGTRVTALTTLPLNQGQNIKLEMVDMGKPPILVPVEAEKTTTQVQQAMRQLLPQQTGLADIISSITTLAQTGSNLRTAIDVATPTVGEQLRFLARDIMQQLPRYTDASTAKGFKNALQSSGVFLENQLATAAINQQSVPASDLKANLLRLLAMLQRLSASTAAQTNTTSKTPTEGRADLHRAVLPPLRHAPPQAQAKAQPTLAQQSTPQAMMTELMRQVTGALARIQLHQLASISTEEEPNRVQHTELPLRHDHGVDIFHIRMEEDKGQKNKASEDRDWSVSLAFDIGKFGPIHVKLTLVQNLINTTFWAEQENTKHMIDTQLQILHKNYIDAGLGIGHMVCHHGNPPEPAQATKTSEFILDIKV